MADLDELYIQTINDQRNYLEKLQIAFNNRCDEITSTATEKLKGVPESDTETRQQIYTAQKKDLDEALAQLKKEIDSSNRKARTKLEEIHSKREESEIQNLEKMMENA